VTDAGDFVREALRKGSGIAAAIGIMNVTTYGFTVLSSHQLGPGEFGGLASLLGVILIANVPALGLQATTARLAATRGSDRAGLRHAALAATWRTAGLIGALCLVLAPALYLLLDLDSLGTAALVAATAVPLTLMGGQAGILQGERLWPWLGAVYVTMGVGRLGLGLLLVPVTSTTFGAMLAVAGGAWLPVLVGWLALRRTHPAPVDGRPGPGAVEVLRETAVNSYSLLAFFCLSNADVVVARASLDPHQAGLYAAGLVLTKAVLFLPQFVVVLAFPTMAARSHQRRTHLLPLALVAVIGVVTTLGTAVLDDVAVTFVGGSQYAEITPYIWAFAVLGTILAMIQLLVYALVAKQDRTSTLGIWIASLAVVGVALLAPGAGALIASVVAVDGVLLLVLVAAATRRRTPTATAPVPS
jgi:O-antigen/teichoic acid export membrane protein